MAARDTERYYWLKLDRGFFKRHDIAVIEDMPNGKDYVLFYLKLMLESVDHEGALRFSDTIPYSESMLASVTRTNVDIVRSALNLFIELGMVEVFDDKTLFMKEVAKLLDSETYSAKRKRDGNPAGNAAAGAFVGLGREGDAGRLGGLAGSLAGGEPGGLFRDIQAPFVIAGEDERSLGSLFGAQGDGVVSRKVDGSLVGVFLLLLLRFHRHGFRLCTGKDRDDGHHGNKRKSSHAFEKMQEPGSRVPGSCERNKVLTQLP